MTAQIWKIVFWVVCCFISVCTRSISKWISGCCWWWEEGRIFCWLLMCTFVLIIVKNTKHFPAVRLCGLSTILILITKRLIEARVQGVVSIHARLSQVGAESLIQWIIPDNDRRGIEWASIKDVGIVFYHLPRWHRVRGWGEVAIIWTCCLVQRALVLPLNSVAWEGI